MPIRNKVDLINLKDFSSYIEFDNSLLSTGLFDIVDFPEKLTAGKNLFKIRMQNDRFADGSKVYIEVLDYNGTPLFYKPLQYIEKDGTRVVSIYIYPNTSPGNAIVYVAGRIKIDNQGNNIPFSRDAASRDYLDIPNVLWTRNVPIAPFANNTTEIIYTKQPSVTITELVQPYRQPVNVTNIFTQVSSSSSTFTIRPQGNTQTVVQDTNLNKSISGDNKINTQKEKTVFQGQFSKNSPNQNVGEQISLQKETISSLKESSGKTTTSETVSTISNTSVISIENLPLSKSMEGGTLTIKNPLIQVPKGTNINSDNQVVPFSQITDGPELTTNSAEALPLSGSYDFAILNVLTKNSALIGQISGFKNETDNTFGGFAVEINSTVTQKDGPDITSKVLVDRIDTSTNITASFIKDSDVVFTENSSSFADIIIADTEPATGDVYRIKTLFKPSGFFGDFIDLGDTILEQQNILIDTSSFETNVTIGSFFENFGIFESLQEIQTYWSGSVVGGLSTSALTLAYDTDTLLGGARLDTDWTNGGDSLTAQPNDASVFEIKNIYRPEIFTNTTYVVRFKVALPPDINTYKSNDPNIPDNRLDIYVNNEIAVDNPIKNISLGSATILNTFQETLSNNDFKNNGTLGTRIGTIVASSTPNLISSVELTFKALATEKLDIKFVTRKGFFILGDIEVLSDKETGYTPGYVRLTKRVPTEHLRTPLTFKFQYFDITGQKADIETFAYGAVFDGGNQYIDGTSNIVTGSVFVGNKVGSGIEIAGVKSGFVRSVGYQGSIDAASGTGPGGFLIFSGSEALNIGSNNYQGVGIELVGNNDESHLIFSTSGSGSFDIKAQSFFIGDTGSQFISGANSNIEISSSLFHLDPQENLLVIGADAVINADLSANQLFVPAGTTKANARAYISSSGEAGFIGDGAGNYSIILDGRDGGTSVIAGLTASANSLSTATYTISASTNITDPVSFISSSNFKVSAGGAITGSAVLLGNKGAGNFLQFVDDTLTVQGSITADNIRTPATIDGSPSTDANASSSISAQGLAKFVSASIAGFIVNTEEIKSSNESLRLKSGGQITGSNVLFTGGEIGGFELSSDQIKSSNNNLRLKDSGQITGSTVLFTGGTIGGFELVSTQINSSNDNLILKDSGQITGSDVLFDGGTIGGFTLTSDKITGNNLIIDSAGILQTADYASDVKGWKLSSANNGFLEVENAKIRGTLSTAVFEKETVNAVGGQLYVANSTTLTSSALHPSDDYLPTDTTMSVVNVTGFAVDEILTLKKVTNTGFSTEYVRIESASRNDPGSENDFSGNIYVIRGYSGSVPTANTASLGGTAGHPQSYSGSQVIVSTGKIGTGYIRLNANPNDQATPYIDIVERTGSSIYDIQLKARLGDLSGLANSDLVFNKSNPGFGLATDNVFLQGGITATFGTIGGFGISANTISSSNDNLILRDTGQITGSTVLFTGGDIGGFVLSSDEIRSSNNNLRLKANGQITASAAQITGKITAQEGTIGGFNIGTNLESSGGTLNLKGSTGQITGSDVLFDGGEIGGFELSDDFLKSTNDNLVLRASGQITGSILQIEGGFIGAVRNHPLRGFIINDSQLFSAGGGGVPRRFVLDTGHSSNIGLNSRTQGFGMMFLPQSGSNSSGRIASASIQFDAGGALNISSSAILSAFDPSDYPGSETTLIQLKALSSNNKLVMAFDNQGDGVNYSYFSGSSTGEEAETLRDFGIGNNPDGSILFRVGGMTHQKPGIGYLGDEAAGTAKIHFNLDITGSSTKDITGFDTISATSGSFSSISGASPLSISSDNFNVNALGQVTASSFKGDGSGLTGIGSSTFNLANANDRDRSITMNTSTYPNNSIIFVDLSTLGGESATSTDLTLTLPSPSAGLKYTFIVKGNATSITVYKVQTPSSGQLTGQHINTTSTVAFTDQTSITINSNSAVKGTKYELLSDGSKWFITAFVNSGAGTVSIA